MKKWTYRQKRDLLDKLEPWITALVQLISALAGAAVGISYLLLFLSGYVAVAVIKDTTKMV